MYEFYAAPATLEEALAVKAQYGERARIVAGAPRLMAARLASLPER